MPLQPTGNVLLDVYNYLSKEGKQTRRADADIQTNQAQALKNQNDAFWSDIIPMQWTDVGSRSTQAGAAATQAGASATEAKTNAQVKPWETWNRDPSNPDYQKIAALSAASQSAMYNPDMAPQMKTILKGFYPELGKADEQAAAQKQADLSKFFGNGTTAKPGEAPKASQGFNPTNLLVDPTKSSVKPNVQPQQSPVPNFAMDQTTGLREPIQYNNEGQRQESVRNGVIEDSKQSINAWLGNLMQQMRASSLPARDAVFGVSAADLASPERAQLLRLQPSIQQKRKDVEKSLSGRWF